MKGDNLGPVIGFVITVGILLFLLVRKYGWGEKSREGASDVDARRKELDENIKRLKIELGKVPQGDPSINDEAKQRATDDVKEKRENEVRSKKAEQEALKKKLEEELAQNEKEKKLREEKEKAKKRFEEDQEMFRRQAFAKRHAQRQEEQAKQRKEEQEKREREAASRNRTSTSNPVKNGAYYGKVLGLVGQVTMTDVKKKYRELCAQYHPDKVSHLGCKLKRVAEDEMKQINEAYEYFKRTYK